MRILIAPDDFKGTLTASQAATAIADGWARTRPDTEFALRPVSDGGPGFVAALAAARDVPVRMARAQDSFGRPVDAQWCVAGATAYLEVAQVVGLHTGADVLHATSFGVGELIREALGAGVQEIVIGLGGTNVSDGGAGLMAALGATAVDASGRTLSLDLGPLALSTVVAVDLEGPLGLVSTTRLTVATDVDVPLLGPRGATYGFAPQKGALDADLLRLETAMAAFAAACGRRDDGKDAAVALGAGAAGGLGFALLRLGGTRVAGIECVLESSDLALDGVDLIVTGEGALDWQSMRGKAVTGVAKRGLDRGIPVIAIAGRVDITARERSEMGLDAAYSVSEMEGEDAALALPAEALAAAAARVARTWG